MPGWSGDGWPPSIATVPGGSFTNAETNALAAAITPAPASIWLTAVDTCISALKSAGVWAKLDLLYGWAAPNQDACTWNWKDTTVGRLTANGTINYTTNTCVASNGTTGFFSSSYNVNSGNAQNGTAHFGFFCLSECTTDNVSPFQSVGGGHYLGMQRVDNTVANLFCGCNTSSAATYSSLWGSTVGHWAVQQNNTSGQIELFIDGASQGTSAQTNSIDTGAVQLLKHTSGAFTTRKIGFIHYGAKLTAPEHLALSKALYTFLTALDVRPKSGFVQTTDGPTNVAPYKHCPMGDGQSSIIIPCTHQWSGYPQGRGGAYPYALQKVNDPNYLSLWRFEHHIGDMQPAWDGTEPLVQRLHLSATNANFNYATTCDLAYSFYIEPGSSIGTGTNARFITLAEVHDATGGTVSPGPFSALSELGNPSGAGKYYVWAFHQPTGSDLIRGAKFDCAQGVWHRVRHTFRMDNSPNAFIQSWFDGVQVLNYSPGPWSTSSIQPFRPMLSLYCSTFNAAGVGPSAIWYANYEFDSSGTQPYASRITTPLPVPPL